MLENPVAISLELHTVGCASHFEVHSVGLIRPDPELFRHRSAGDLDVTEGSFDFCFAVTIRAAAVDSSSESA